MEFDDFDEDDDYFSPPPHPDDRLWRHPSEIARGMAYIPGADDAVGDMSGGITDPASARGDTDLLARVAARWPLSLAVAGAAVVFAMVGSSQFLSNQSATDALPLVAQTSSADITISSARPESQWQESLRDHVEHSMPRIEVLYGADGAHMRQGRGIMISESGHILTSAQLIDQADAIIVRTADGQRLQARVEGADPLTDVAVVKIIDPDTDYPVANLAIDSTVQIGQYALAVTKVDHASLTTGQIMDVGNKSLLDNGRLSYGVITVAVDPADIDPGTAVFDDQGRMLGMVPMLDGTGATTAAVPIALAHRIASELVLGDFERPWLGIRVREAAVPGSVRGSIVEVVEVFDSGPAGRSDISVGDRITRVNNVDITSTSDLLMAVWSMNSTDEVDVGILRGLEHFVEPLILMPRPAVSSDTD